MCLDGLRAHQRVQCSCCMAWRTIHPSALPQRALPKRALPQRALPRAVLIHNLTRAALSAYIEGRAAPQMHQRRLIVRPGRLFLRLIPSQVHLPPLGAPAPALHLRSAPRPDMVDWWSVSVREDPADPGTPPSAAASLQAALQSAGKPSSTLQTAAMPCIRTAVPRLCWNSMDAKGLQVATRIKESLLLGSGWWGCPLQE